MTYTRQRTGRLAEARAAEYLLSLGYGMVARNARTKYGELDMIVVDRRALVFVEVKAGRANSDFGPERPVHAVDRRKQQRIRRLATAWLGERRGLPYYAEIRFDAVGVTLDRADEVIDLEHLPGAF